MLQHAGRKFWPSSVPLSVLWVAGGFLIAEESGPIAVEMWSRFRSLTWQRDIASWRRDHAGADCRRSDITTTSLPNADDEFCSDCIATAGGVASSHFFYAFDLEPLTCNLLQFRTASPPVTSDAASRIYDTLRGRLAQAYGPGRDAGRVSERGSADWRQTWLWKTHNFEALLFVNETGGLAKVELLARHGRLLEAKADDARISSLLRDDFEARERQFYLPLADQLNTGLPKLPGLLGLADPWKADADTVLAHLRILVAHAEIAPADRKPMFLLAADRLGRILEDHLWKGPFDGQHRRHLKVRSFVLTYEWDTLGGIRVYDHALLRHVYRTYSDTLWGEWAFLTLQKRGWHSGAGCPSDPALFRQVIAESERFLNRHPNSPYRLDTLFDAAQAYETWWSLSQASPQDDYVKAADYAAGADEARKRALELYGQVSREAPEGDFAAYARRVLPRLKLRLDTGQRRYYCIYD